MKNADLLKRLGNLDQICGIRESEILTGPGKGTHIAEFHNAAGLRFTVVPDHCMDIYDLSYKGTNISFLSRNGLRSPGSFVPAASEFSQQWSGGMLATCGLDNVGLDCSINGVYYPIHGRISSIPATSFGTLCDWKEGEYTLEARGEVHQTRLYGSHLSLNRTINTTLNGKSIRISDRITNLDANAEPFMLLYHCNFGYPLLDACSRVLTTSATIEPLNSISSRPSSLTEPIDNRPEELFLCRTRTKRAVAMLYNPEKQLAGYVAFDTAVLPNFLEWKMMKSHDYVLALEPCNTCGLPRDKAIKENRIASIAPYSSVESSLEIGIIDGIEEIASFIKQNELSENA